MKSIFKNRKISAIVSVVPKEEYRFDDEYPIFKLTPDKAKRFKKMMSLDRHRIAAPGRLFFRPVPVRPATPVE